MTFPAEAEQTGPEAPKTDGESSADLKTATIKFSKDFTEEQRRTLTLVAEKIQEIGSTKSVEIKGNAVIVTCHAAPSAAIAQIAFRKAIEQIAKNECLNAAKIRNILRESRKEYDSRQKAVQARATAQRAFAAAKPAPEVTYNDDIVREINGKPLDKLMVIASSDRRMHTNALQAFRVLDGCKIEYSPPNGAAAGLKVSFPQYADPEKTQEMRAKIEAAMIDVENWLQQQHPNAFNIQVAEQLIKNSQLPVPRPATKDRGPASNTIKYVIDTIGEKPAEEFLTILSENQRLPSLRAFGDNKDLGVAVTHTGGAASGFPLQMVATFKLEDGRLNESKVRLIKAILDEMSRYQNAGHPLSPKAAKAIIERYTAGKSGKAAAIAPSFAGVAAPSAQGRPAANQNSGRAGTPHILMPSNSPELVHRRTMNGLSKKAQQLIQQIEMPPLLAITPGQEAYLEAMRNSKIFLGKGPAGGGKSYMQVGHAIELLVMGIVDRIILTKPAVDDEEPLGYRPGDVKDKVAEHYATYYDKFSRQLSGGNLTKGWELLDGLMDEDVIQVQPFAFMRGKSNSHACQILDEAGSATLKQCKTFMTRAEGTSFIIISGDTEQIDLKNESKSGFSLIYDAFQKNPIPGKMGFAELTDEDAMARNPDLVHILGVFRDAIEPAYREKQERERFRRPRDIGPAGPVPA